MFFVVFKLQGWETVHSYTLVDNLDVIDPETILVSKSVPNKHYSKQELESLRAELLEGAQDDN